MNAFTRNDKTFLQQSSTSTNLMRVRGYDDFGHPHARGDLILQLQLPRSLSHQVSRLRSVCGWSRQPCTDIERDSLTQVITSNHRLGLPRCQSNCG